MSWDSLTVPKEMRIATVRQIDEEVEAFVEMLEALRAAWLSQRQIKGAGLAQRRAKLLYLLRKAHHQVKYYADRGE